jgi:hypothetical protein
MNRKQRELLFRQPVETLLNATDPGMVDDKQECLYLFRHYTSKASFGS